VESTARGAGDSVAGENTNPVSITAMTAPVLNVPNSLALTRIVLTPVVMAFVLLSDQIDHAFGIALAVFVPAALTDFADGYLARRWKITTVLGAFLDSVADKILVVGSLLVLIEVQRAWSWAAFIIIGRELAVMGLRAVAALEKSTVPPSFWGKSKTTFQFLAIGFALIRSGSELGPFFLDEWLMLIAVVATVLSGWDYFRRYATAFAENRPVDASRADD
jgi:CDP-diacylglycerol--glycerol-3-phosphate 3-phosphatidyltransferase